MLFTNLTRSNEIGANSYLLDFEADGRMVLDAGMHPRDEGMSGLPRLSPQEAEREAWQSLARIILSSSEFVYVD